MINGPLQAMWLAMIGEFLTWVVQGPSCVFRHPYNPEVLMLWGSGVCGIFYAHEPVLNIHISCLGAVFRQYGCNNISSSYFML